MKTMKWKVYGLEGHRQRVSFRESTRDDFSKDGKTRIIEIQNSDMTGTNEYSIISITMDTEEECTRELEAQISDGAFENSNVGRVEEIRQL